MSDCETETFNCFSAVSIACICLDNIVKYVFYPSTTKVCISMQGCQVVILAAKLLCNSLLYKLLYNSLHYHPLLCNTKEEMWCLRQLFKIIADFLSRHPHSKENLVNNSLYLLLRWLSNKRHIFLMEFLTFSILLLSSSVYLFLGPQNIWSMIHFVSLLILDNCACMVFLYCLLKQSLVKY